MALRETANARVDAPADRVFGIVTDIGRLPEWNAGIVEVADAPPQLKPGSEWKVRVRALGQTWVSKSTVTDLDPTVHRFAYRSQSDDGNPSYADWEWTVAPDGSSCVVTVTADLNPRTFWRKHLLIKIRRSGLRKEMAASLTALGGLAQT